MLISISDMVILCLYKQMIKDWLSSRILLSVATLLVLVPDDYPTQFLLLLLLNCLLSFLNHIHLLWILHHFCKIVLRSQIRNPVLFQHLPPFHCCLYRCFIALYHTTSTQSYNASSLFISSSGSLISPTSTEISRLSFQGRLVSSRFKARCKPSYISQYSLYDVQYLWLLLLVSDPSLRREHVTLHQIAHYNSHPLYPIISMVLILLWTHEKGWIKKYEEMKWGDVRDSLSILTTLDNQNKRRCHTRLKQTNLV